MVIKFSCSESRFMKMGVSHLTKLISEAKASKDVITLEATVITGFELQAVEECKEKCKPENVARGKGRIFFNIKKDNYPSVFKLRAVDNVFIVNESFDILKFTHNKEKDVEIIKGLVSKVDWAKCVPQWAELTGFKGVQFPKCAKKDSSEPLADNEPTCQQCLAPLKQPATSAFEDAVGAQPEEIELQANPTISVDDHDPPQPLKDCDKDVLTVRDVDLAKLTANKLDSDDDSSFHSAEEDCVESHSDVKMVMGSEIGPVKTIEPSKCVPDSLSGGEVSEYLKDLPIQSEEVSESPDKVTAMDDQQSGGTDEEESVKDEAALVVEDLCQKSQLLSVSNGVTESCGDPEKCAESIDDTEKGAESIDDTEKGAESIDSKNETKREKRMSYWKRLREERKEGKGKKKVAKEPPKPYIDDGIIKFRVTCYRSGKKHSFDSNDAAMHFGGLINDEFHWTVDLTRWDINVVLVIEDRSGYVTFGLTKESFHRRNISHFGPTTLRSTLCYSLIRFAEPRTGDIVIDPMCGGGSISIEGAKGFPKTFHICGDNNEKCVDRTKENMFFNTKTEAINMDAFHWDVKSLPLKDQSVDVLVTDLPFGLRIGKWKDNNALYDTVLRELARVVRSGSGRAALLTYDKAAMIKGLKKNSDLWREIRTAMVNHGGIRCVVFLLLRKALLVEEKADKIEHDSGEKLEKMDEEDYSHCDQSAYSQPPDASLTEKLSTNELLSTSKDSEQSVLAASEETDTDKSLPTKPCRKSYRNRRRSDRKQRKSIDEHPTFKEKSDQVPRQDGGKHDPSQDIDMKSA